LIKSGDSTLRYNEKTSPPSPVDIAFEQYGDILFDLATTFLPDPDGRIQFVTQTIKAFVREQKKIKTEKYQRELILQIAVEKLKHILKKWTRRKLSPEEILLDTALSTEGRLKSIKIYLTRLSIDDQLILFFVDKHGLPLREVSTFLKTNPSSLNTRRQQVYRILEEWIWNTL
jgi:hypothetical protein